MTAAARRCAGFRAGRGSAAWTALAALGWLLLAAPSGAEAPWQVAERGDAADDAWVLYVRPSEGGPYPAYKVEILLRASPAEAVRGVFQVMASQRFVPRRQERRILERADDGMLIYTFIDMPPGVSDRDLALRVQRHASDEGGVHRVSWKGVPDEGPERRKRVVRIADVWGYWEFAPEGPDRSRGVYVTYADLGGSIPGWLVRPMMREQVTADVRHLRTVLEERSRAVSAPPPRSSRLAPGEDGVPYRR